MIGKNNLLFWRGKSNRGTIISLCVVIVLLLCGGSFGYYYFIYKPEQARLLEQERLRAERQQKITNVDNYYTQTLSGGDILDFENLVTEIMRAHAQLDWLGYFISTIDCDATGCKLSYKLNNGRVFSVTDISFFGKVYTANFSSNIIDYAGLPSELEHHPWYDEWKKGKDVKMPDCTSLLNYINTWNSISSGDHNVTLENMPASSVVDDEIGVKDAVNVLGMLSTTWSVEMKDNTSLPQLVSMLAKQNYRQAFVIKTLKFNDNTTTVGGDLVCKKGI